MLADAQQRLAPFAQPAYQRLFPSVQGAGRLRMLPVLNLLYSYYLVRNFRTRIVEYGVVQGLPRIASSSL